MNATARRAVEDAFLRVMRARHPDRRFEAVQDLPVLDLLPGGKEEGAEGFAPAPGEIDGLVAMPQPSVREAQFRWVADDRRQSVLFEQTLEQQKLRVEILR